MAPVTPALVKKSATSRRAASWGRHALLLFFAVLSFYPILVMWFTALRPMREAMTDPFGLPTSLYLENVTTAWTRGRFGDYFLNSVIITVPSVIGVVVLSALAGYGVARFRFRGRMLIFYLILLGLTVPFQSVMIPLY